LKVKIAEKWEGMIPALMDGTGAFIAASLTITPKRQQQVAFSDGYLAIQQHIIVHRKNPSIKNTDDLAGKTIHVRRGTSYQERLETLKAQDIDLNIELHDDIPTEELIQQVEEENIEVTIADSNIAYRNRRYYPKIIVSGPISPTEYLGWAVHPNALKLLKKINTFFKEIKTNGFFKKNYDQYYANVEDFDFVDLRSYHRRLKTRLPKYRPIIKQAAQKHGFDWRLIAAQIYQESHFDPKARSHAGAYGLMQLTRSTAKSLKVKNMLNSIQNINAGVQHLKNMYDLFDGANGSDRLFIAFAAYNIGQGHIMDARNLARKTGLDPNKWSSLTKTLPLLRYHKYYKNAAYGYCHGTEPIEYVKQIMIYYDILRHRGIEYRTDAIPLMKTSNKKV
jgi:membrane-bound lytic murein transglycosylase F